MQKAIQDRREERRIRKENIEKNKRKQSASKAAPGKDEDQPQVSDGHDGLDLLPSSVLEDVARQDDDDDYEREDDRRITQRRLVSEQLKQGLMQGKKRQFTEKQVGPVIVKTLHGVSSRSATGMFMLLRMF